MSLHTNTGNFYDGHHAECAQKYSSTSDQVTRGSGREGRVRSTLRRRALFPLTAECAIQDHSADEQKTRFTGVTKSYNLYFPSVAPAESERNQRPRQALLDSVGDLRNATPLPCTKHAYEQYMMRTDAALTPARYAGLTCEPIYR